LKGANIREGFCTSVLYHQEEASLRQMFLKNLHYGESIPSFVKQTKRLIFPSMLSHALLVFAEIVKEPPRLDLVLGCFLLFSVKSGSMLIGVLRGAGR
jgi:hypothetical protein